MANGNIPEPTPGVPWYNDGRFIIVVLGMLFGFATTTINSCVATNNARDASAHAAAASASSSTNAVKIDAAKEQAEKAADKAAVVATKIDSVERKADQIKGALPPK